MARAARSAATPRSAAPSGNPRVGRPGTPRKLAAAARLASASAPAANHQASRHPPVSTIMAEARPRAAPRGMYAPHSAMAALRRPPVTTAAMMPGAAETMSRKPSPSNTRAVSSVPKPGAAAAAAAASVAMAAPSSSARRAPSRPASNPSGSPASPASSAKTETSIAAPASGWPKASASVVSAAGTLPTWMATATPSPTMAATTGQ